MNNAVTKSAIQILAEIQDIRNTFMSNLNELLESYEVKNNVFVCDASGIAEDCKQGYYAEESTYLDLKEAIQYCNPITQGIRVHDGKFSVGSIYTRLNDVPAGSGLIVDCAAGKII